jgi:hypothetical protein
MSKLEELKDDLITADAAYNTARHEHADASEALDDASEYLMEATEAYQTELGKQRGQETK